MICIVCDLEVEGMDYMQIGLDRPYINLKVHRECYDKNKPQLNEILLQKFEMWYNKYVAINEEKHGKSVRKSRKTVRKQ